MRCAPSGTARTGIAPSQPDGLDPAQQAAATGGGRVQLVLAGPGSGKTTTLTARFVGLVRTGIDCSRILALTFSKKAADEMKARIVEVLGPAAADSVNVATFHAFAFRHLRRNPGLAGLGSGFQLWDAPQQRRIFNSRRMWWNEEQDVLDIIGGAKERLLDAERFAAGIDPKDRVLGRAVEFFRVYESALRGAGAIDFADMVPLMVRAMDRHPEYAAAITGAFDHLLVDEYQDVNPGQVELIDRFVRSGNRLWAVGDDDQTLYAFRAADVRFILGFAEKYPGAQVHVLDRNYRSGAVLVEAAKRLIANNRARHPKQYRSAVGYRGEIVVRGYSTSRIEARQVGKAVATLIGGGRSPADIAVLYRIASVGLALQPVLRDLQILYEVRGAGDLWQSVPARLVVGSLYYLRDGASVEAMSRMGSSRRAEIVRSRLDETRSLASFAAACDLVHKVVAGAMPGQASDRDRAEWTSVVEAVVAAASACGSLEELESRIAEQSNALRQPSGKAVVLSTVHSAKGLEWDAVFVIGVEKGVLPHVNNADLEEERRVAYVAITRAKRLLGITYSIERFGQPSRPSAFIAELAGKGRQHCIWSDPRRERTDECLPLLSDRERRQPHERGGGPGSRAGGPTGRRLKKDQAPALRRGLPWDAEEDARLRASFRKGEAVAAIARAHQRSRGAITSRLVKLGLVSEDGEVLQS